MNVSVYVPILASLVLGTAGPRLARALPPATAVRALTAATALVALTTSFVIAVLAFTVIGSLPWVASLGHWSTAALSASNPVPQSVGAAACLAVLVLAVCGGRAAVRRGRALLAARALCVGLGGGPGQLVIIDSDLGEVYAVPGDHGRIVASRQLLADLPAPRRRALLAHESSHLVHRHHLHRLVVDLAAAVNPLLRPLVGGVRFATERWADEDAAAATSRGAVAETVLWLSERQAGATIGGPHLTATLLPAGETAVVRRVRALVRPPARSPRLAVPVLALFLLGTVGAAADAQRDAEALFEQSRASTTPASTSASLR